MKTISQVLFSLMQQLELITIENPCINVCQSDNRGYCLGCFRSRDERFNWAKMTSPEKRKVLELCKGRNKRRKAKEKKTELKNTTQTQEPITAQMNTSPTGPNKQKNQQNPEESSCVAKTDQSVQDMGLDLFDL